MFPTLSPHHYFFWLLVVSALCFGLERLAPWRRNQGAFRAQIWQDYFWLLFNGHFAGVLIGQAGTSLLSRGSEIASLPQIQPVLADSPYWLQFGVVLVLKDLLEWGIHNLLHRVPWLWEFHKVHHSILELDWIGNMRFHWMEIVVYRSLTYLPLASIGAAGPVLLWAAIVSTLVGHLNHANLRLDWGPLRYILNSPRFHIWHHDIILRGEHGKNFAIIFSAWDWIFGTAVWPAEEQPAQLGFTGIERYPAGLFGRLTYPASRWFRS